MQTVADITAHYPVTGHMEREHFADRLFRAVEEKQSQVVVGLDPRLDLIPDSVIHEAAREHGQTPAGAAAAIVLFNRAVLDAVCEAAVAVKLQIAFYERFGCEGLRAYAETVRQARDKGLIVIGDVKRNDIGSTAEAYAAAHLPGSGGSKWEAPPDFHADAITINPLFGWDGIAPFVERAAAAGCGLFALVKTSNPSSAEFQDLDCDGAPLYEHMAAAVERWGEGCRGACGYSLLGAVVGATFPKALRELRALMPHAILLVPGLGAQGGTTRDVTAAFDREGRGALVSSSRSVIYAYRQVPYAQTCGVGNWEAAVAAAAHEMRREVWSATRGGGRA